MSLNYLAVLKAAFYFAKIKTKNPKTPFLRDFKNQIPPHSKIPKKRH